MNIAQQMEALKAQTAELKKAFDNYIVDQAVPLVERWTTWKDAPTELKNHKGWIEHFKNLPEDFIMYDGPIHAERCETLDLVDVVERVEEGVDCEDEGFAGIDVDALKEEILSKNLGSFCYDW